MREVRDTVARLSGYGCVKFGIRLRDCRDTVAGSSGYGCATVGIRLREVWDTAARLVVDGTVALLNGYGFFISRIRYVTVRIR